MSTTVYFATNRVVTNPADPVNGYIASMVPPSAPNEITYGTAFVDGVDIATNATGAVSQIINVNRGAFSQEAIGDLSNPGRNLFVFIHGFDNSFSDAITRAAFNREWLAASDNPGADTAVVAFSWPSLGKAVSLPIPQADYLTDQHMAKNSGLHLMAFLANLSPLRRPPGLAGSERRFWPTAWEIWPSSSEWRTGSCMATGTTPCWT